MLSLAPRAALPTIAFRPGDRPLEAPRMDSRATPKTFTGRGLPAAVLETPAWLDGRFRHLAQRVQLVAAVVDDDRHADVTDGRCLGLHGSDTVLESAHHDQRRHRDGRSDDKEGFGHDMHPRNYRLVPLLPRRNFPAPTLRDPPCFHPPQKRTTELNILLT